MAPLRKPGKLFVFNYSPDSASLIKLYALPTDTIACRLDDVDALAQFARGTRSALFNSYADASQAVPNIAHKVKAIGYDPEQRPQTPPEEQTALAEYSARFNILARANGLTATVGPDRNLDVMFGDDIAPNFSQYALQLQDFGADLVRIKVFAVDLIKSIRQANPAIKIIAQLRTDLTTGQLFSIAGNKTQPPAIDIDGVGLIGDVARMDSFLKAWR